MQSLMLSQFARLMPLLFMLGGCTTLASSPPPHWSAQPVACYPALHALDQLAAQQAGSLYGERIAHAPWLRSNRWLASRISAGKAAQVPELLLAMSQLARTGLLSEAATLTPATLQNWRQRYGTHQPLAPFFDNCAQQLRAQQQRQPSATYQWLTQLPADNDYSTLARVLGLYPLANIPFRMGVVREQHTLAADWGKIAAHSEQTNVIYSPDFIESTSAQDLLKQHAPVWWVASNTPANLPGTPFWQGTNLQTDTRKPASFAFVSHARWQQQDLLQLNYVIWFSARPALQTLDWVAGQHDAVVFRVNLDASGKVMAYDSMHLCGCWYRLFLPEGIPYTPKPDNHWQEPVLMQRVAANGERMRVYLSADTHQIIFMQPAKADTLPSARGADHKTERKTYVLRPFQDLLSLPAGNGIRPIFDQRGYVPGSERPERWLFWPMGVKNPGALRRFGDHAISFIGQRFFDEADLLEKLGVHPM